MFCPWRAYSVREIQMMETFKKQCKIIAKGIPPRNQGSWCRTGLMGVALWTWKSFIHSWVADRLKFMSFFWHFSLEIVLALLTWLVCRVELWLFFCTQALLCVYRRKEFLGIVLWTWLAVCPWVRACIGMFQVPLGLE